MKAFKGFNKDMTCRDFRFEEGKTYEEPEANLCKSGFHACENPLDCLSYYVPSDSVYHEVELEDVCDKREKDSKLCAKRITVGARLTIAGIVKGAVSFVFEKVKATTGDWSHAATTGDSAHAATTGDWSHAATTGYRAHAATTGNEAHAATTGDWSHAATTGDWSHAATTGDEAHAESSGKNSISAALGVDSMAKASIGSWIVCAEYNERRELLDVKCAKVDGITMKPDTWYKLENGEFVEVDS